MATSAERAPDLTPSRRIHVVGVGGAGMSALASVLAAMGHHVTGSDLKASPVTERLRAQGVTVAIGHLPEQVHGAELVTYSPAVRPDNVELVEAGRLGLPLVRRAELLAAVAATRRCVAVAGTHGKTTTCTMLSLILVEAGLRPSFLIGADVNEIGTNAVWDSGEWMVLEADESYGSFAALRPDVAVLTNVEPDHLDHYGSFEALRQAFGSFLAAASGRRVVGADDAVAAELGRTLGAATVGTDPEADYRIEAVEATRTSVAFELAPHDSEGVRLELPVPGLHNARNAAVAAVAALGVGAPLEAAARALARFTGVPRRFEFRGRAGGVTFVDDYAHLANEVRATLSAARTGGWDRVVAVFQPHRYSRTGALASSFGSAFEGADLLVVTDVYGAGEAPVPGVSGQLVVDAVRAAAPDLEVHYVSSRRQVADAVAPLLRPGDLCLTLGAGDLTTLPDELMVLLG